MISSKIHEAKSLIATNCPRVLYVFSSHRAFIRAPGTATALHPRWLADFKVAALKEALYRGGIAPETLKV